MSTTVPPSPPGPVMVKVVNGFEFEIVNVPPPLEGSGDPGGQKTAVTTFPTIVAQRISCICCKRK